AASECFGVSGMISSPYQGLKSIVSSKEDPDRGVRVRINEGKLIVDLHIAVTYGVNISAIVKSIVHKVRYTVEESTGLAVAKVNVYVDSMSAQ
ncbi:MAG: Asp23/Gls24 family envelope stress response protein, partial [Angelakisella sp.]